jgi:hypothetical protein
VERLLSPALDSGIKEFDFWEMTIAEVLRAIESTNRVKKAEATERATLDYILASLITKGVGITLGSKETFPTIEAVYPSLFTDIQEEEKRKMQEQKNNLSALRFLQFAQSYNKKFKDKEVQKPK